MTHATAFSSGPSFARTPPPNSSPSPLAGVVKLVVVVVAGIFAFIALGVLPTLLLVGAAIALFNRGQNSHDEPRATRTPPFTPSPHAFFGSGHAQQHRTQPAYRTHVPFDSGRAHFGSAHGGPQRCQDPDTNVRFGSGIHRH